MPSVDIFVQGKRAKYTLVGCNSLGHLTNLNEDSMKNFSPIKSKFLCFWPLVINS